MKRSEQIFKKFYFRTTIKKSMKKLQVRMMNVFLKMQNTPTTILMSCSTINYTKKSKNYKLIQIKFRQEKSIFNLSTTRLAVGQLELVKSQLINLMIILWLTRMHHFFNSLKTYQSLLSSNLTSFLKIKSNAKRREVGRLLTTKMMTSQ